MAIISLSLVDDHHRLGTELHEQELYAIGYITVSWAQLEHILLAVTIELAEKAKISLPEDATSLSFKKRLRAWRVLIKSSRGPKKRERLLGIANKIGSIERSRNRITHGLWDWTFPNPELVQAASYRPPHFFEEPFDFEKLMKLGDRISEINFQLTYPGGKKQAHKEWAETMTQHGWHVSRDGALALQGKDPSDHRLPQPTPLKYK